MIKAFIILRFPAIFGEKMRNSHVIFQAQSCYLASIFVTPCCPCWSHCHTMLTLVMLCLLLLHCVCLCSHILITIEILMTPYNLNILVLKRRHIIYYLPAQLIVITLFLLYKTPTKFMHMHVAMTASFKYTKLKNLV